MRDFRNAKAMAQTLRAALAAKGVKITVGQSLELIAEIFGLTDWNTLAAAIRAEKSISRENVSPPLPAVSGNSFPPLSAALAATLHRAFGFASRRKHEYATLEHLMLALIDDADASAVMRVCSADLGALAEKLVDYPRQRTEETGDRQRRRLQTNRCVSARRPARRGSGKGARPLHGNRGKHPRSHNFRNAEPCCAASR